MQTTHAHPAQHSPQSNNSGFKYLAGSGLALLVVFAIAGHLFTDALALFLSVFFDSYSLQSNSLIPDMVLLLMLTTMMMGIWHSVKNHLAVSVIVLVVWSLATAYIYDRETTTAKENSKSDFLTRLMKEGK